MLPLCLSEFVTLLAVETGRDYRQAVSRENVIDLSIVRVHALSRSMG